MDKDKEDQMKQYAVPTLFYSDHRARECGESGVIVKKGKRLTIVLLDKEAYDDLLTDSDYYATFKGSDDYKENKNIVESAIRTLKILKENN